MSKIPLATPRPGTPEYEALAKQKRLKRSLITSLITLTTIAILVGLLVYITYRHETDKEHLITQVLSDAFGVAGVLGLGIFGLAFVSSKGAFDLLSYSVKLVFLNTFRPKYRQESFPKSFYEYKVKKDTLDRKAPLMMLFVALAYLAIGILMSVIFNSIA